MIVGALFLGPIYALFTPAAFIYPLFISLLALRFDVRLCIFTGAVAGLEYSLLAIYLVQQAGGTVVEPILTGSPQHIFKGFLLVLTVVVTGPVTLQIRKRMLKSFSVVEERFRVSRAFGEQVSAEVMGKLLDLEPICEARTRMCV